MLESALADVPPTVDGRMLAQGRLSLGRGLRYLEEYLPAAEELLRLADAGRFDEALPEAEYAIAAHDEGGQRGELPRAEAVRIAALIEGNGLDRADEAIFHLTAASARCRQAGHPEAAHVLDTLRQDLRTR
ncbi:hypothetical protein [Streptomyces sp. WAC01280]|uniref:hypothetical protein n=1 Tax=Streptomyces sp. WAC01280 TaxID=2487424 RepID=UPI000F769DBD|nr:hypothetical protein [Streptomyces sp. WAC01280]RSS57382.1 hypothetical protein EF909_15510 [Streptomyces sp. WAC01280]